MVECPGMRMKHVFVWVTPLYQPRLNGIARYARAHGWHLTIADRTGSLPSGWRGDGALMTIRDDPEAIAFVKALRRRGTPVVDLTYNHPELHLPRVTGDHAEFGRLAADYFGERHYTNAAWFSRGWMNIHRLRYDGFTGAWSGGKPERWVLSEMLRTASRGDFAAIARILRSRLANSPKPLAVLAYDDNDAATLLTVCLDAKIAVPDEVAILGIGDDQFVCENQEVPLSSILHDQERTGYEGAALLDRLMSGGKPPATPILIPSGGIVTRASSDSFAVKSPALRRALLYINENLAHPFSVDQVAEAAHLPRRTLERLFETELGRSCGKEALNRRLVQAKTLLRNENLSIKEIAAACGFCDQAYFSNAFNRAFGRSPRAARRDITSRGTEP